MFDERDDRGDDDDDDDDGENPIAPNARVFHAGLTAADAEFLVVLISSYRNTATIVRRAWDLLAEQKAEAARELTTALLDSLHDLAVVIDDARAAKAREG